MSAVAQKSPQMIAVTVGDPSGIGPEIVCKAIASLAAVRRYRLRVVCHGEWFAGLAQTLRCDIEGATLVDVQLGDPTDPGPAQIAYLERAVALAAAGDVAAIVTAPIHKGRARASGFSFPGHTEFLAQRLGAQRVAMMFAGPSLRVVLATIHLPLAEVPKALTEQSIGDAIDLGIEALRRDFSIANPRIGVLGLNPHAGEGGVIGREEIETIGPAVLAARGRHPSATILGPLVPDAAFREKVDLFVAMYHDQALIPIKLLDFDRAVNVTLGLPIVRTSPDHGTADDIAGKGVARPDSLIAALDLAFEMID